MDFKHLAGSIAADKNSKKLGKIIRIDNLPGKTTKKLKPYAIIIVHRIFSKDVVIPLDLELLMKVEREYVWFDILKKDFDEIAKQQQSVEKVREVYGKFVAPGGNVKTPMYLPRNERKDNGRRKR